MSSPCLTTETFDDLETGQPTQYGRFSRNWQDEEAMDVPIDMLEADQFSQKQARLTFTQDTNNPAFRKFELPHPQRNGSLYFQLAHRLGELTGGSVMARQQRALPGMGG